MSKILLTSGCSFSECINHHISTWPRHLAKELEQYGYIKHTSSAMGSQGNGLISRGTMYNVIEALKTYDPKDILVGVMWSASHRYDFRCTNPSDLLFVQEKTHNGWIENPTQFVKGAPKNWVILNHHWGADQDGHRNPEAKLFYKHFYDEIGMTIRTLEHILRLQFFLQTKNVPYFFTNAMDYNIVSKALLETENQEFQYLYDQLDLDNYLPVNSEYRWVRENSKRLDLWGPNELKGPWTHPKNEHHKEFVDNVICPFLIKKGIIAVDN